MNFRIMRRVAGPLMLAWVLPTFSLAADELYVAGKRNWRVAQYPPAYNLLLQYRVAPYGRTAEVDYMLGTSACRMEGLRDRGAQMLSWLFYNYALTNRSRDLVAREWNNCRATSTALEELRGDALNAVESLISAGATVRAKMFYWMDQGSPVASYPAKALREIDPALLKARVVSLTDEPGARKSVRSLAPGFRVERAGRFIFATNVAAHGKPALTRFAQRLEQYIDFLATRYGIVKPDHFLTIYLVSGVGDLRKLGERIHGLDISPATIGYTFRDDLSAVAVIPGEQIGTLFHELFHLLVRNNFGDIPQWLDEGMAGLYEVSAACPGEVRGLPNWRGRVLKEFWHLRPSVAQVISADWFNAEAPEVGHPTDDLDEKTQRMAATMAAARYFVLYLQERNLLQALYEKFQRRDPFSSTGTDPRAQALSLVENVFQQPIRDIDRDFADWFKRLPLDGSRAPVGQECFAIEKYTPG
ncbi:MAG: hypothetical protein ACKVQA_16550 [Burkholderiales bacterium]